MGVVAVTGPGVHRQESSWSGPGRAGADAPGGERVAGRDDREWEAFLDGYQAGVTRGNGDGHAEGYRQAMTVLDDAGALLAAQKPSRNPSFAELQRRRNTYEGPARAPEQILTEAAASWGLPVPEPPAAAHRAPSAEELSDDDDWAWQA